MISYLCRFTGKQEASFSCIAEFEKVRCIEFQEGSLRDRNSLFRASVMESRTESNGKFRSEQWKVYNYIGAMES